MRKIIVAHPDKQHSFYLASALQKNEELYRYITTVYCKDDSITQKYIIKFLKGKNFKKALSRKSEVLNDSNVLQFNEVYNLIIILLSKFPFTLDICRYLRKKLSDRFGKNVAKYAIENDVDIVIMYDGTALKCFEKLSKDAPKIKKILDVTTLNHSFMKKVFEEAMSKSGSDLLKKEFKYLWDKSFLKRYDDEIFLSDYYLVPSGIVQKSLYYNKVSPNQILKVPYGVDTLKFSNSKRKIGGKIKLLFVGQVTTRKGIDTLLDAVSNFESSSTVELIVAGAYDKNSSWYRKYEKLKNVKFLGFVTRDLISELYKSCHVFVLPSLAEGLALVGLEAMASGLPIICSEYSGVNDLVINRHNGFVIDENSNSLTNLIQFFCDISNDEYEKMSYNARETALSYSWNSYELNVINELKHI